MCSVKSLLGASRSVFWFLIDFVCFFSTIPAGITIQLEDFVR